MFKISEMTKATIDSVTPRVEKHGDDDRPAVSLKLSIEAPNTLLDAIDPNIRRALYMAKPDETPELPGVEQSTPVLRCNSFEKHTLTTAHEGWTLGVDSDIDETEGMRFGGCKVDKLSVEAKQGGSIVLSFRVGTSDIDADRMGWLGMHNGEDIWITLTPPEPKAEAIDGTTGHPGVSGPTAEDLFAAGGPDPADSEGGETDVAGRGDNWPLPRGDAQGGDGASADLQPGASRAARTERGYRKTREALEKGMAEHAAAGAK